MINKIFLKISSLTREIVSKLSDDAKYEHGGQDTKSQGGKDDQDEKDKDLKISDQKTNVRDKYNTVGSNDMVHNYYLEEAKKKALLQKDKALNTKPGVQQYARLPNTVNELNSLASAPKKDAQSIKTTKIYMPVEKKSDSKKHDRQIPIGQKLSPNKSSTVYQKTMTPRSCLRWKLTSRIFKTIGLRWVPTRKIFASSTTKRRESIFAKPDHMIASRKSRNSSKNMPRFSSNDMVHNHYLDEARKKTQERDRNSITSVIPSARFQSTADGSKPKPKSTNHSTRSIPVSKSSYISNIHESKQNLDLSAGTSINVQKEQCFDLSEEVPTTDMISMTTMIELESLFGPSFDEYFNGENQVVSKPSAVTTADASNKHQQQPDSTSYTSTLATTVTADGNFDL
nr:hypothetical protein [Tanacetum cinerariifolium]